MRVVSIRLKPSEVFRKYGSIDGALLVEARLRRPLPLPASVARLTRVAPFAWARNLCCSCPPRPSSTTW